MTKQLPELKDDGKAHVAAIRGALIVAGLPRLSNLNGGDLTGWTKAYGSTGFSVRRITEDTEYDMAARYGGETGDLYYHVVVSGKAAGVAYRQTFQYDDRDSFEPVDADKLHGRIKAVFASLGFEVKGIHTAGWQTHWDDDIDYGIVVKAKS